MGVLAQVHEEVVKSVPFYKTQDAVVAFIKALQRFLGLAATGGWNKATHDALSRFMTPHVDVAFPLWGKDPNQVAFYATGLVLSIETEEEFALVQNLFLLLGLPSDYTEFEGMMSSTEGKGDSTGVQNALQAVAEHIRQVEWGEIPEATTPTGNTTNTGLVTDNSNPDGPHADQDPALQTGSTTTGTPVTTTTTTVPSTSTNSTAIVPVGTAAASVAVSSSNKWLWVLGIVGVGIAGYLLYRHYTKGSEQEGMEESPATAGLGCGCGR